MELGIIFLIWLLITIVDGLGKRKKNRIPPPQNQGDSSTFEIPTLANDPNFPGEEVPIYVESPRQAEVRPKNFQPPRPKKIVEPVRESEEAHELDLNLTPTTVMDAVIFSEILGKPKALRGK